MKRVLVEDVSIDQEESREFLHYVHQSKAFCCAERILTSKGKTYEKTKDAKIMNNIRSLHHIY